MYNISLEAQYSTAKEKAKANGYKEKNMTQTIKKLTTTKDIDKEKHGAHKSGHDDEKEPSQTPRACTHAHTNVTETHDSTQFNLSLTHPHELNPLF